MTAILQVVTNLRLRQLTPLSSWYGDSTRIVTAILHHPYYELERTTTNYSELERTTTNYYELYSYEHTCARYECEREQLCHKQKCVRSVLL